MTILKSNLKLSTLYSLKGQGTFVHRNIFFHTFDKLFPTASNKRTYYANDYDDTCSPGLTLSTAYSSLM